MRRPRKRGAKSTGAAEADLARLRRDLVSLGRRVARAEARLQGLARLAEAQRHREQTVARVLRLGARGKKEHRGVIPEMQESIVRLEEYLLKTAERIETILSALKQHREFLVSVNQRVLDLGTKDRIRLELDVMKNTLSILALNGIEFDGSLVKEIDKLKSSVRGTTDLEQLERSKADLDKKFDGELRKFDLDAIWTKKKEIPGYR
ncbi:MAG TPA: hypothetical protein VI999_08700 [Thermoplasmata archaeon]|nr:hypothetical protein [Thermoplasmata archaeon]